MSTQDKCGMHLDLERVTLKDGRSVTIRPVCRKDGELEKSLIEGLSPESRRDRFIGGSCKASEKLIELLTDNDHEQHEAFIAVDESGDKPRAVAVANYALDDDGRACECAVVVSDDWQHEGLGRIMLQQLIDVARARGIEIMYSIESADNIKVKKFAHAMGFVCKADPRDYTLLTYTLDLQPEEAPIGLIQQHQRPAMQSQ
ncbi:GNAT family N-acetyltransferase [Microbulbifer hainanensis]|uniref:GNAT family N-acetyltransferase n=1 Tax=Microbulbifer hainanensis TaxID=2735675 RepID=UPI0018682AE7|nr:GNAT family N-acetyltransferase [Microbulbifer hainanensis]